LEEKMPKIKSNSGALKRFKVTANGKIKKKKAYHSHLLTHKARKRKRQLRKADYLTGGEVKHVRRLLPYL